MGACTVHRRDTLATVDSWVPDLVTRARESVATSRNASLTGRFELEREMTSRSPCQLGGRMLGHNRAKSRSTCPKSVATELGVAEESYLSCL